ncbi:hypothetical protein BY996DRAFT_6420955 [Phakopsora pachyrhizi]|nr:hypothetical protein BY996DRAFT_6420955 [Phakopsora pachyrhizi]
MTVQHKPCAYCSLLLSALFLATCSWDISSTDVSPVYLSRWDSLTSKASISIHQNTSDPSLLDSMLSFYRSESIRPRSNEESTTEGQGDSSEFGNHQPFDYIYPDNHQKNQSDQKDTKVSNSKSGQDKKIDNLRGYRSLSRVGQGTDDDEDDGDSRARSDDNFLKKPGLQIANVLSQIFQPLSRLSSSTNTNKIQKLQKVSSMEKNHLKNRGDRQRVGEGLYRIKGPWKSSEPNSEADLDGEDQRPEQQEKRSFRSSFSKTPLVYTHLMKPILKLLSSKVLTKRLRMILRILMINQKNILSLPSELSRSVSPHIQSYSQWIGIGTRLDGSWTEKLTGGLNLYRWPGGFSVERIRGSVGLGDLEIRLNELIGLKIVWA